MGAMNVLQQKQTGKIRHTCRLFEKAIGNLMVSLHCATGFFYMQLLNPHHPIARCEMASSFWVYVKFDLNVNSKQK